MRRQAERLLDRTRDECERNELGKLCIEGWVRVDLEPMGIKLSTTTTHPVPPGFSIDAQWYGNVARFLNHSCDPNLIKQTVFVESHDVRGPRVAFFALFDIPAREELTYDYGYTPGSVDGKTLPCLCGAADCRKFLY